MALFTVHRLNALACTVNNILQRHESGYNCRVRKHKFKTFRVEIGLAQKVEGISNEEFRRRMSANAIVEDCVDAMLRLIDLPPGERVVPNLIKQVDAARSPAIALPEPSSAVDQKVIQAAGSAAQSTQIGLAGAIAPPGTPVSVPPPASERDSNLRKSPKRQKPKS